MKKLNSNSDKLGKGECEGKPWKNKGKWREDEQEIFSEGKNKFTKSKYRENVNFGTLGEGIFDFT
jgi:hypothetical protein